MGIALMMYPPENNYSIMKDTISFLGSKDDDNNPEGWYWLSIAFIYAGLLLIPLHMYIYRKMKPIANFAARIGFFFFLLSSIGLILVAIFPDNRGGSFYEDLDAGKLHNLSALVAFGGLGFGILWYFLMLVKDQVPKMKGRKEIPAISWIGPYILFFTVVTLTAYTQIKWDIMCDSGCWPGDGIYSFPLWEWILFFTIFIYLIWIALSVPDSSEN